MRKLNPYLELDYPKLLPIVREMLLENPTDRLDFKEVLSQLSVLEKDEREKAQKSKKYNELLKKYEQVCASLEATKNYIKDCDSMDRFLRILMSLI